MDIEKELLLRITSLLAGLAVAAVAAVAYLAVLAHAHARGRMLAGMHRELAREIEKRKADGETARLDRYEKLQEHVKRLIEREGLPRPRTKA